MTLYSRGPYPRPRLGGSLVSLVLEALKKLDREKGRHERGFVVMAAAPWPTRAARRWPAWAALAWRRRAPSSAVVALRTAGTPAPAAGGAPAPWPRAVADAAPRRPRARRRRAPASLATTAGRGGDARRAPAPKRGRPSIPAPVRSPSRRTCRRVPIRDRASRPSASATASPSRSINDHLVRVGDEIDGVRVLAIRVDEVDVEVRGRRTTLRF